MTKTDNELVQELLQHWGKQDLDLIGQYRKGPGPGVGFFNHLMDEQGRLLTLPGGIAAKPAAVILDATLDDGAYYQFRAVLNDAAQREKHSNPYYLKAIPNSIVRKQPVGGMPRSGEGRPVVSAGDLFFVVKTFPAGNHVFAHRLTSRASEGHSGDLYVSFDSFSPPVTQVAVGQLIAAEAQEQSTGKFRARKGKSRRLGDRDWKRLEPELLVEAYQGLKNYRFSDRHDSYVPAQSAKRQKEFYAALCAIPQFSKDLEWLAREATQVSHVNTLLKYRAEQVAKVLGNCGPQRGKTALGGLYNRLPSSARSPIFRQWSQRLESSEEGGLRGLLAGDAESVPIAMERHGEAIVRILCDAGPDKVMKAIGGAYAHMADDDRARVYTHFLNDQSGSNAGLASLVNAAINEPLVHLLMDRYEAEVLEILRAAGPHDGLRSLGGLYGRLDPAFRVALSDAWLVQTRDQHGPAAARRLAASRAHDFSPSLVAEVWSTMFDVVVPVPPLPLEHNGYVSGSFTAAEIVRCASELSAATTRLTAGGDRGARVAFLDAYRRVKMMYRFFNSARLKIERGNESMFLGIERSLAEAYMCFNALVAQETAELKGAEAALRRGELRAVDEPVTTVGRTLYEAFVANSQGVSPERLPDHIVNFLRSRLVDDGYQRDLHQALYSRSSVYSYGESRVKYRLGDVFEALGVPEVTTEYKGAIPKIESWLTRLYQIPHHFFCHECESFLRPNLRYAQDDAAYNATVFHCVNPGCGHNVTAPKRYEVYLNHCFSCYITIDSRLSVHKCESDWYTCPDCSGCCKARKEKYVRRGQRCCTDPFHRRNPSHVSTWTELRSGFIRTLLKEGKQNTRLAWLARAERRRARMVAEVALSAAD